MGSRRRLSSDGKPLASLLRYRVLRLFASLPLSTSTSTERPRRNPQRKADSLWCRLVEDGLPNGPSVVSGFEDDYYMVAADVAITGSNKADLFVHYVDPNNSYKVHMDISTLPAGITLCKGL